MDRFLHLLRGGGLASVLLRGAVSSAGVGAFSSLAAVLAQIVLARALGADGFGLYTVAITFFTLVGILSRFGFDTATVRFAAAYRVAESWAELRGLLRFGDRWVLGASVLLGGLCALGVFLLRGRLEPGLPEVLWIGCGLLPVFGLLGQRVGALRAFRAVGQSRAVDELVRPALTIGVLGVAGLVVGTFEGWLSAPGAVVLHLVATGAAVGVGWILLRRYLPPAFRRARVREERAEWLRVSAPLLLVAGMRRLLNQTDILLVGFLLGAKEAGFYAVASRLSRMVSFGLNASNGIAGPLISELHSQGDRAGIQRVAGLASWGSTGTALLALVAFAVGAPLVLGLYGDDFKAALLPLAILAAGQLVNSATGPVGQLLNMTGHQGVNARILAWTTGLNLLLNLPAILWLGSVGAALVTSALVAFKNLWTWREVRRSLGVDSSILASFR